MKKILVVIIAIFTIGNFSASAQKFGHINYKKVTDTLQAFKTGYAKIEEEQESFESTYKALEEELNKRYQIYMASVDTMNPYLAKIEEESLNNLNASLQGLQQQYQSSMQIIQERYFAPIEEWLEEAVGIVGKNKGLDYILYYSEENKMMWVNPNKGVDVSNAVITEMIRLEKENPIKEPGQ